MNLYILLGRKLGKCSIILGIYKTNKKANSKIDDYIVAGHNFDDFEIEEHDLESKENE